MITLQKQIKTDLKAAMIEKNSGLRDLLRVVIGEFDRIGKEVADDKALAVVKKMRQNALDQKNQDEADLLNPYIPQQLTELELVDIIAGFDAEFNLKSMQDMGFIMKTLKERYGGQYDGKMAAGSVKDFFICKPTE